MVSGLKKLLAGLLVATVMLPAAPMVIDTVNARITLNGKNFVPIVTSHQRLDSFGFWKRMGCNTTCYIESPNTWTQWTAALESSGLYGMPYGETYLANRHDQVIGYYLKGEPDIAPEGGTPPNTPAETMVATARSAAVKAGAYPLMICFEGGHILYHFTGDEGETYYRTVAGAVPFVCQDIYPIMRDQNAERFYDIASATKKLIRYVDYKKPVGAFIESGRIAAAPGRGPTPGEFEAEVWTAIGAGAKFILYFPVGFDPWLRNNLEGFTANEDKMIETNALITELTDVIMEDPVSVSEYGFRRTFTGPTVQHHMYFRQLGADLYMFSVATRAEATSYKIDFTYSGTHPVEVVGEDRTIAYTAGGIEDAVTTDKTSHVYRIVDFYTTDIREGLGVPAVNTYLGVWQEGAVLRVAYDLRATTDVTFRLYNMAGSPVSYDHGLKAVTRGIHQDRFEMNGVGSGVYTVVLEAGSEIRIEKISFVK